MYSLTTKVYRQTPTCEYLQTDMTCNVWKQSPCSRFQQLQQSLHNTTYSKGSTSGTFILFLFLQIVKEDVDSYGFYNAGLPQLSIDLRATYGCSEILNHEINIEGATNSELSFFLRAYLDASIQG